ncbi:hypothetical protein BofuT4_P081590.1 [Botrytis cinerea T4]|uniref:Uncharacterized protein n=1 Tax=Botryotinia fuckeliana (strain T4) TaxID=999810 RepID=G2YK52_BOTF4|nr:hypothetical protein BofuT4_P081590.1 [Botrytis cinerea T4]
MFQFPFTAATPIGQLGFLVLQNASVLRIYNLPFPLTSHKSVFALKCREF